MLHDHLTYDPEATVQEADLLMASYAEEARRADALREQGVCLHSSVVGRSADGTVHYPEQEGLAAGQVRCTEGCGRVFDSDEELQAEIDDLLR